MLDVAPLPGDGSYAMEPTTRVLPRRVPAGGHSRLLLQSALGCCTVARARRSVCAVHTHRQHRQHRQHKRRNPRSASRHLGRVAVKYVPRPRCTRSKPTLPLPSTCVQAPSASLRMTRATAAPAARSPTAPSLSTGNCYGVHARCWYVARLQCHRQPLAWCGRRPCVGAATLRPWLQLQDCNTTSASSIAAGKRDDVFPVLAVACGCYVPCLQLQLRRPTRALLDRRCLLPARWYWQAPRALRGAAAAHATAAACRPAGRPLPAAELVAAPPS